MWPSKKMTKPTKDKVELPILKKRKIQELLWVDHDEEDPRESPKNDNNNSAMPSHLEKEEFDKLKDDAVPTPT